MGLALLYDSVAASPLVGELGAGVVGKRVSFLLPVATLLPGSSEGIFSSDHPLVPQSPEALGGARRHYWRPEMELKQNGWVMLSEAPGCPARGSGT